MLLNLFKQIIEWRRMRVLLATATGIDDCGFQWCDLHLSIVHDYFLNLSTTCDFMNLPFARFFNVAFRYAVFNGAFRYTGPGSSRIRAKIAASFAHELQIFFMVPMPRKCENPIKKYQLVEAFITFLLRLLDHQTYFIIGPCKDRIDNLEKKLRFLHTILGDTSLMQYDEHEEFQELLSEFETVANKAGSLFHSLFFSADRAFEKIDEGIGAVLNHINLLKANIMRFLDLLPYISRSIHITPKTSVTDSLLIIDSLIHDLEDLMNREDNPIVAVKDQIKILHQGLIFLHSSIKDTGVPQPSEIGELKEPLMRIGDMAHVAEYLIISFLVVDIPIWYLINRLTYVNHKIELIGTELQEIAKKYRFGGLKVAEYFSTQLSLQAKRNTEVDDVTVGFEDKATYILDKLVGGTERLQFISIFGMPGLGKTTLAKKLYNHPSVNYWFDKISWCVVSQTYLKQSILTDILIHITSEFDKDSILKMEEESLVEHIYKTLKGRRYLIVMDDMWDSNVWDDFWRCFPDDGNGSRILFTTRNKDVAPSNSTIYALPSLSNDQCWELLKKKVFDDKCCPPELLGIGKEIAANCCGLPLAVVVIAGILSAMDKEKSTWEEVRGNLASYMFDGGDNSVMEILELSYKHLPERLKPCFLYFGAFEEDKEIPVRKLKRLWIAEGFVHKEEEKSADNVAEEYLMELIDKSLIMVAEKRSDGGVKACVIHDLLRDLCLKRSEEENFPKFMKSDSIYSIFEKRPLRLKAFEHSVSWIFCQHVRSMCGRGLIIPIYVRDMKLLRVWDFYFPSYIYNHYFIGIEFLVNLRYLVVPNLPASIGSLVNLEYLRVKAYKKVYLPPAIVKLRKLSHIQVFPDARFDKDWNSSQTTNLEFLSNVVINDVKDESILKCSPHLRKLKCSFGYSHFHFDLQFLTQLDSLNVSFEDYDIEKISFPSNIRKLTLTLSGMRFSWKKMSIFGRLENLEVLKLRLDGYEGKRWDTRNGEFQKLRYLKLDSENLTQWNVTSSEHFPMLQQLVLCHCENLQEIPCEIGEITTLQLIELQGECPKSVVKSAKIIQKEQWEMGNEELRIFIHRYLRDRNILAAMGKLFSG